MSTAFRCASTASKNCRRGLLSLTALVAGLTMQAQQPPATADADATVTYQPPAWVTAPCAAGEAVGHGVDSLSARRDAIAALLRRLVVPDSATLAADSSLYATMVREAAADGGAATPFDPVAPMADIGVGSPAFATLRYVDPNTGDGAWVKVGTRPADLRAWADTLYQTATTRGAALLAEARTLRREGLTGRAAETYCQAIALTAPCIVMSMPTDEGDLAALLADGLASLYDGLTVAFACDSCPVVPGEEVAATLCIKATDRSGQRLAGLPVIVWSRHSDARIEADSTTRPDGTAEVRILRAPKSPRTRLLAAVDVDRLGQLPALYAAPALARHLRDSITQGSTMLTAFDPTPFFAIDLEAGDSLQTPTLTRLLATEATGWQPAADDRQPDIVARLAYTSAEGEAVKAGAYHIRQDSCTLTLHLTDARSGEALLAMPTASLTLRVPAERNPEKVRPLAVRQLVRRLAELLPPVLASYRYDKRAVIYRRAEQEWRQAIEKRQSSEESEQSEKSE